MENKISGSVSAFQVQGKRDEQEDFYIHLKFPFGYLMAVFDGTIGKQTAKYASERVAALFKPKKGLINESLVKLARDLARETGDLYAASTLAIACVLEKEQLVVTATMGDSPIFVVGPDGKTKGTVEHNARSNMSERIEAVERGGSFDGCHMMNRNLTEGLQMTRVLGAKLMGPVVKRVAEIETFHIGPDSVVLVASDGLIDPSHLAKNNLTIKHIISMATSGSTAEEIVRWRESKDPRDNITLVLWQPKKK